MGAAVGISSVTQWVTAVDDVGMDVIGVPARGVVSVRIGLSVLSVWGSGVNVLLSPIVTSVMADVIMETVVMSAVVVICVVWLMTVTSSDDSSEEWLSEDSDESDDWSDSEEECL